MPTPLFKVTGRSGANCLAAIPVIGLLAYKHQRVIIHSVQSTCLASSDARTAESKRTLLLSRLHSLCSVSISCAASLSYRFRKVRVRQTACHVQTLAFIDLFPLPASSPNFGRNRTVIGPMQAHVSRRPPDATVSGRDGPRCIFRSRRPRAIRSSCPDHSELKPLRLLRAVTTNTTSSAQSQVRNRVQN